PLISARVRAADRKSILQPVGRRALLPERVLVVLEGDAARGDPQLAVVGAHDLALVEVLNRNAVDVVGVRAARRRERRVAHRLYERQRVLVLLAAIGPERGRDKPGAVIGLLSVMRRHLAVLGDV